MAVVTTAAASSNRKPAVHEGFTPWWTTTEAATTSLDGTDDDLLLFLFPRRAFIPGVSLGLRVSMDDLDSDATPAIVSDFGLGDVDGVIDQVLINNSTIGQAGGKDSMDSGVNIMLTASSLYLIHTIVTPADIAVAGTIEAAGTFTTGIIQLDDTF